MFLAAVSLQLDNSEHLSQLTSSLNDLVMASCLGGVDIVPWIVENLVQKIKKAASKLDVFVPENLYLPAPPVYCPQPTPLDEVNLLFVLV